VDCEPADAVYNGGATALLARIIASGTGSRARYARAALFDPLGIGPTTGSPPHRRGICGIGLRMTPRDLARIGQLLLDGGEWARQARAADRVGRAHNDARGRHR